MAKKAKKHKRQTAPKLQQGAPVTQQTTHSLIQEILTICEDYIESGNTASIGRLTGKIGNLTAQGLRPWVPSDPVARPDLFVRLQGMIAYLISTSDQPVKIDRIQELVDAICEAVFQGRWNLYGNYSEKIGRLNFTAIKLLKQAYWSARQRQSKENRSDRRGHSTHKVIRVNDAPFAEAVYPDLMHRFAGELGYSIEVVGNIDWSEVGMALYTKRIDVAFYNGSIKRQFAGLVNQFEQRLVYRTGTLFRYKRYPILRNPRFLPDAKGKIVVPWRSDFQEVVLSHDSAKPGVAPQKNITFTTTGFGQVHGRTIKINKDTGIVYVGTVDEALERFINGELEYCITGGLQAEYAHAQFRDRVERCGYLDRSPRSIVSGDDDVFFCAAVERRHEAERLLNPMIAIWNDHVFGRWEAIVSGLGTEMKEVRRNLLELVNAYNHSAFVKDFDVLSTLIKRHDHDRRLITDPIGPL